MANKNSISIFWIIPQFIALSISEILLSVTALEFVYAEAPKSMKGTMTAFWILTQGVGTLLDALIALINLDIYILNLIFAGTIFVVLIIFIYIARNYKYQSFSYEESIIN